MTINRFAFMEFISMDETKKQSERFKEAARELGADESPDALDRIMGKLDLKKKPEPEKTPVDE
jgi:hypothetical protein